MNKIPKLGIAVPNDWAVSSLDLHTSKIGSGATPRGGSSVYVAKGIALIRSQNVYDHTFKKDGLAYLSDEAADALKGVALRENDVLINITGDSILRTTIVPTDILPARVNQHVSIVRSDGSLVPMFIQKWLSTPAMKDYMLGLSSGGTRKAITKGHIQSLPIPVPPLPEQRAIAATLGALDDKIESNQHSVFLLNELIDAFSEKYGERLESVALGELVTVNKKSVNPQKLGDVDVNHFSLPAFDAGARPEIVPAATILSNKYVVPQNAILVSRLNPRFDRTWWVSLSEDVPALASTEYLVLSTKTHLDLAAVWLAVRDPYFRDELPKRVTGTSGSHQRVRPDDVLNIEVPDFRSVSAKIKSATLSLLERADGLRREADKLSSLRDALLPELMSGRIRVDEAREVINEETAR